MRRTLVVLTVLLSFPGAAPAQLPAGPVVSILAPASSSFGETVTLTSTVLLAGVPVTAGTVVFSDAIPGGGVVCEDRPLDAQGVATCQVTPAAGLHSFVASYAGALPSLPALHSVSKALVTITAAPRTITYGQGLPTDLTATASGAGAGLITGTPACAIAGAPANAGTYDDAIACTAGTLDVANFLLDFEPGDLTIARAPATVTANPVTMTAGQALPAVTSTVSGLIGGDTLDVACTGPSPPPAEPGAYPGALTCLAESLNYAITLVPGTLTVVAAALPIPGTPGGGGAGGGGSSTTNHSTTNVTNVGIAGGNPVQPPPAVKPSLSLLTKKLKRSRRARLRLRSTGAVSALNLVLKRDGRSVGRASLAALNGDVTVTVRAARKLKKGVYTLLATWAGGGKKRFNVRVR